MPRGRGLQSGHNHVLAAIADAIHAHSTYKGSGKGGWDNGGGRELAGRNCGTCGDYNFEHRINCRKCGASLPPPSTGKGNLSHTHASGGSKAWGGKGGGPGPKGGGGTHGYTASAGGGGGGAGSAGKGQVEPRPAANCAATTTGSASAVDDGTEGQDPAERIKEIRTEEERIRKSKAQFTDSNPRIVAMLDAELAALAAERERLQPLEVNLQAAAGRTAHARAHLAKIKEKREAAAKSLRERIEALKEADKEVEEAEAKLRAAEAAATARKSEGTFSRAQDAFDFLQRDVTAKCSDSAIAAQLAEAFKGIAGLLAAANAAHQTTAGGTKSAGDAGGAATETGSGSTAAAAATPQAVPGASASQRRRTEGSAEGTGAAGVTGAVDVGGDAGGLGAQRGGGGAELFAGGTVDGEVTMGDVVRNNKRGAAEVEDSSEDLLRQAAAALGEDEI
jgi:hypothetical protein